MFCLLLCCPFLILRGMEMLSVDNYLMTFTTSSCLKELPVRQLCSQAKRNNPHPWCSIWMMRVSYIMGIMLFLSLKLNNRVCVCVCACVCKLARVWAYSHTIMLSHVWLFVTPRTVAPRLLCSWNFWSQEYRSGLPFSTPGESSWPRDQTHIPCISCLGKQIL